jgi:two-component system LytT family sensor kinase
LDQMIIANISLDIFSIILSMVPTIYLMDGQYRSSESNKYFLGVCIANILMIIGDMADWMIRDTSWMFVRISLFFLTMLYYVASGLVLYFFARYLEVYLKLSGKVRRVYLTLIVFFCSIQIFFAVASPFTGWIFCVTDNGYQRGSLFLISQIIPFFCGILFLAMVILHCRKMSGREVIFFLLYFFTPVCASVVQTVLRGIAIVNLGVTFALILILVNIQFEHEIALRQQEKKLAEQRIDIMLSQIQPHFLYNTLGTIACLCRDDPQKAEKATEEFAKFLRGNMDSLKARGPIPFERELSHVMNYLYLEKQRFGDRLNVVYKVEATDFFIPPLSLQPLVENAVRHGILKKKEGGTITICTMESDEYAVVMIVDDGIGMEKAGGLPNLGEHGHIGIENVRDRLWIMVKGRMEVDSSDQGTRITLRIPWTGGQGCVF